MAARSVRKIVDPSTSQSHCHCIRDKQAGHTCVDERCDTGTCSSTFLHRLHWIVGQPKLLDPSHWCRIVRAGKFNFRLVGCMDHWPVVAGCACRSAHQVMVDQRFIHVYMMIALSRSSCMHGPGWLIRTTRVDPAMINTIIKQQVTARVGGRAPENLLDTYQDRGRGAHVTQCFICRSPHAAWYILGKPRAMSRLLENTEQNS